MASYSAALKTELLTGHPDTGAYNADDALAASELNVLNRIRERTIMSAGEIMESIDGPEFEALTDANQGRVDRVLGLGAEIIIGPGNNHSAVQEMLVFGAQSVTLIALAALRDISVSRADELGFPVQTGATVGFARNL